MLQYTFELEEGTGNRLNRAIDQLAAREQILKLHDSDKAIAQYEAAFLELEKIKRLILHDYICPNVIASKQYSYEFFPIANQLRVAIPDQFRADESKWLKELDPIIPLEEPIHIEREICYDDFKSDQCLQDR